MRRRPRGRQLLRRRREHAPRLHHHHRPWRSSDELVGKMKRTTADSDARRRPRCREGSGGGEQCGENAEDAGGGRRCSQLGCLGEGVVGESSAGGTGKMPVVGGAALCSAVSGRGWWGREVRGARARCRWWVALLSARQSLGRGGGARPSEGHVGHTGGEQPLLMAWGGQEGRAGRERPPWRPHPWTPGHGGKRATALRRRRA